jgi:hypothetical protein
MGGFVGNLPLLFLYVLFGSLFSLSLSLLFGSLFNSVQSASTVSGFVLVIIIAGELGQLLSTGLVLKFLWVLPSYHLADGMVNASQNSWTAGGKPMDVAIILGSSLSLLVISAWTLCR